MVIQKAGANLEAAAAAVQIIHREEKWLGSGFGDTDLASSRISVSRWAGNAPERFEKESQIAPDCHVLGIALQPIDDVTVYAARKLINTGRLPRGSVRLNEPGLPMRGIFCGRYDVLHLHIPNSMISEYASIGDGQRPKLPLYSDNPTVDPVIERLSHALIQADALGVLGRCYADGISLAITAKLFGGNTAAPSADSRVSSLSKWRLKRATDYMMANLAEPIGLADIAAATGLSRMHFAAQFRLATGVRPHEYLIRQRIKRAQELLFNSRLPLVEIAFEVGFKTQAHFTAVFARRVGETPKVWRQRNCAISGGVFDEALAA